MHSDFCSCSRRRCICQVDGCICHVSQWQRAVACWSLFQCFVIASRLLGPEALQGAAPLLLDCSWLFYRRRRHPQRWRYRSRHRHESGCNSHHVNMLQACRVQVPWLADVRRSWHYLQVTCERAKQNKVKTSSKALTIRLCKVLKHV